MAYNPFSPLNTGVGVRTSTRRRVPSSNARVVFKADNGRPAVIFEFIGRLAGAIGNNFKVNLNRLNDAPRYAIRVCDINDVSLGVVASITDLNGMVAVVAAASDLAPILKMRVIQNVNEVFTAGSTCANGVRARGGV